MKHKLNPFKTLPSMLLLASGMAIAGEPYMEPAPPPPPAPAPSSALWDSGVQWFAGGTAGYLTDAEEGFYSGHIGLEWVYGETSHALYLEVGFTEYEEQYFSRINPLVVGGGAGAALDVDLEIIPVTLNYKYEFPLFENLHGYLGGGAGVSFNSVDIRFQTFESDEDEVVFFGQFFAGLGWDITEQVELYGGGRWVYLDGIDTGFGNTGSSDDFVVEAGLRFNF